MPTDDLPPPAQKREEIEMERMRSIYPVGIRDVMLYRYGAVPPIFDIHPVLVQRRRSPTLRPDNKYYPMVEDAKRRQIHYDERERLRNLARVNDISPRPEWHPPRPVTTLPRCDGPRYIRKINKSLCPRSLNRGLF